MEGKRHMRTTNDTSTEVPEPADAGHSVTGPVMSCLLIVVALATIYGVAVDEPWFLPRTAIIGGLVLAPFVALLGALVVAGVTRRAERPSDQA